MGLIQPEEGDAPLLRPSQRAAGDKSSRPRHVDPIEAGKRDTPGPKAPTGHVDWPRPAEICSRLAAQQHGVVARAQLLQAGLSCHVVDWLVHSRALHPLHRSVYAVGHLVLPAYAAEHAALLACGEPALIGDRSALYLWKIIEAPPPEPHVLVIGHHCRQRPGIRLHRVAAMDNRDIRRRHGLPLTSPARSLIDAAASASRTEVDDFIAEARAHRLIRDGELERVLERCERTRGAAPTRAFLKAEGRPGLTRSRAERLMRRLMQAARLPEPVPNTRVVGWEVDFLWKAEKLVVEVDGPQFHGHRRAYERDRRKDMELTTAGYIVIRITPRQLDEEPLVVVAHIARMLDRLRRKDAG